MLYNYVYLVRISKIRKKNRLSGAGQVLDIPDKRFSTVFTIKSNDIFRLDQDSTYVLPVLAHELNCIRYSYDLNIKLTTRDL
jgi:hypothetical protein